METINPIYNLGRVAVKDESTERTSYYEVREQQQNVLKGSNQKTLRFRIDDLNSYILLSRSYLQLSLKITKANGADLDPLDTGGHDQKTAFKNGLNSIFERAVLKINGQSVNDFSQWHWHKQNLENVFQTREWKKSMGELMHYYDTTETMEVGDVGNTLVLNNIAADGTGQGYLGTQRDELNPATNLAYRRRVASARVSNVLTGVIPLHNLFPFLKAYDRVMRGMQIEIEFGVVDDALLIERPTGPQDYKWQWVGDGAKLFVKRVVPSLRVRSSLNDAISKGFSLNGFSFEDVMVYRYSQAGALNGTNDWRISTTVSRPTRVFVAFQNNDRRDMDGLSEFYNTNDVESVQLFINGQPIPDLKYDVEFPASVAGVNSNSLVVDTAEHKDRLRAYMNLLALSNMDASPLTDELQNPCISRNDWLNKYPIFAFDVANNLPADTAFTGASEILVRYKAGANEACDVIAWVYHEKLADIKFTSTESSIVIS